MFDRIDALDNQTIINSIINNKININDKIDNLDNTIFL